MRTTLTPMLTVKDAARAIAFYGRAFDATEVRPRVTTPSGQIVAELVIEWQRFFVVDENPSAFNLSPQTLRRACGSAWLVDDPDAVAERALGRPVRPPRG